MKLRTKQKKNVIQLTKDNISVIDLKDIGKEAEIHILKYDMTISYDFMLKCRLFFNKLQNTHDYSIIKASAKEPYNRYEVIGRKY